MKGVIILPDGTQLQVDGDASKTSDCFHSFEELYEHRCHLFVLLAQSHPEMAWRSLRHSDGSAHEGWFIAGMRLPTGDITYHLPESMYIMLHDIETKEKAPPWDGHTSKDVIERMSKWNFSRIS
jgi:hypothetical protein